MTAKTQRPYLKLPKEFSYWKRTPSPLGAGSEVMNYASPLARQLWYYLRSMGHVKHQPGWKHGDHHGEDGYILHVVHRGELWHEIKGRRNVAPRSFRLKSGESCLLDLRQELTYGVAGTRPVDLYWAWLNGKDMPRVFLELGADQDPVFVLPDLRRVESLLRELQAITLREPRAYEVASSGLVTLILAQLFASRSDRINAFSLGGTSRPLSESVRKGIDYMIRNYDNPPTSVKHIAEVAGQSLTYFSRRFHQEVGASPIEYMNRYRIEQAKKFLAGGNQPVEQIARSVGFHNQQYFTRTFTRIVGVNPLAYRKNPEHRRKSR